MNLKISRLKLCVMLGLSTLAISTVTSALAQCGMPTKAVKPAAWHPQYGAARLVRTADDDLFLREDGKSMVGMWHVIFTATASKGEAIPATVIDNALAVWHSDRTEIMNSVRPPQDGNFCLGVWEQLDRSHYYLNTSPGMQTSSPIRPRTESETRRVRRSSANGSSWAPTEITLRGTSNWMLMICPTIS